MPSSIEPRQSGMCLTIGNFDGVHPGHQALIKKAADIAGENNLDFALMTFWPHPRLVLPGMPGHYYLAGREERLRLLRSLGVRKIMEISFTPELAAMSARQFVEEYLLPLDLRILVIGHDFTLGHNREGNADFLGGLARGYGFRVEQMPAVTKNGQTVSSTLLRKLISQGDVAEAAKLLGRFYALEGKVVQGFARGRKLGFPTANLDTGNLLLPATGVYAALATVAGASFPAVVNVGRNPTFNGQELTVESHLLDYNGDLYGKELRLEFVARLRGEQKFANANALAEQIDIDIRQARACLQNLTKA